MSWVNCFPDTLPLTIAEKGLPVEMITIILSYLMHKRGDVGLGHRQAGQNDGAWADENCVFPVLNLSGDLL